MKRLAEMDGMHAGSRGDFAHRHAIAEPRVDELARALE